VSLLIVALVGATTAVVLAATSDPGPFTGCLAAKTTTGTPATKGVIYNVKHGSAPLAACLAGDTQVTFGQGPKGDQGAPGPSGIPGVPGKDGAPGASGVPGLNGADGAPGASGVPGVPGADGAPGASGIPGINGAAGARGAPGAAGDSGIHPQIRWNFDTTGVSGHGTTVIPTGTTVTSVSAYITSVSDVPAFCNAIDLTVGFLRTQLATWSRIDLATATPIGATALVGTSVLLTTGDFIGVTPVRCLDSSDVTAVQVPGFPHVTGYLVVNVSPWLLTPVDPFVIP